MGVTRGGMALRRCGQRLKFATLPLLSSVAFRPQPRRLQVDNLEESKPVLVICAEVSTGLGRTESKESYEELGFSVSQTLKPYQTHAYC